MPKYGDDQCKECGGIRVEKSTLCAGCLVKERDILEKEVLIKMTVLGVQRKRIARLEVLIKEAVSYGFRKNQENDYLRKHIKGLERKTREVMDDEESGI